MHANLHYRGFFDDSGSHLSSTIYLVGGFIANRDTWNGFDEAWSAELARDPAIKYLHTADAYSQVGEFAGWPRPLIDKKLFDLAEVVAKFDLCRIDTSVLRSDYDELIYGKFPGPVGDSPYFLCFYRIVTGLAREPSLAGHPFDLVFDEQGTTGCNAVNAWPVLAQMFPEAYQSVSSPIFGNDRTHLPLQAADLYSWHARRYMIERLAEQDTSLMHIHRRFLVLPYLPLAIGKGDLLELVSGFNEIDLGR